MGSKVLKFAKPAATVKNLMKGEVIKQEMRDISFIDLDRTANGNNDIMLMTPEETIQQSIENLLKLPVGGNALFPSRGEQICMMLFNHVMTEDESKNVVKAYIEQNEPRITIHRIDTFITTNELNENIVTMNISYSYKTGSELFDLTVSIAASDRK